MTYYNTSEKHWENTTVQRFGVTNSFLHWNPFQLVWWSNLFHDMTRGRLALTSINKSQSRWRGASDDNVFDSFCLCVSTCEAQARPNRGGSAWRRSTPAAPTCCTVAGRIPTAACASHTKQTNAPYNRCSIPWTKRVQIAAFFSQDCSGWIRKAQLWQNIHANLCFRRFVLLANVTFAPLFRS